MSEQSLGPKRPRRAEDAASASTAESRPLWLPVVGLLVGVWAIVPPYVDAFGRLDVEERVEFADHVVPGVAVLLISVLAYVLLRSPEPSQLLLFMGGATVTLAGFWMVATHFPLIDQGRTEQAEWDVILWHSVPGVVLTLFGLVWTIRFWGTEPDEGGSGR
jgi:hypothetical protein